jgi:hypothetical protein
MPGRLGERMRCEMKKKYVFTNKNYKPICIQYYDSDERAIDEAETLADEMRQVVHICRDLTPHGAATLDKCMVDEREPTG